MLTPLGFNRHNRHCFDDEEISLSGKACLAVALLGLAGAIACRREEPEPPPVATPSFSVNQTRVPLGSPVEVTYKFVMEKNAPPIH